MKTKVLDKKGKKRSISETSTFIKSNQKQENVDELKKSFKKAKFGIKQNGNPTVGEKAPVSKVMDKQKKEQNKIVKQQSSIVKPSETKKEKTELTVVKSKKETDGKIHRGNKTPSMIVKNFTEEQVTKKIAEIKSREMLSKRAKRLLGALKNKLREYENNSEKLDTVDKKSNRKKVEQPANTLKKTNEIKTKAEKKLVTRKDEPQEEDDSDNELEEEEDSDIEEESEEEESDESEAENELIGSLSNKKEEVDDESDEDEEDEEEIESEEDEEEESEDIDDEEGIESEEDEEDEEANEDEEDEDDEEDEEDEEDEKNIIKKSDFLELKKKEVQNKNKQRQNKNKQEQNKNKPEQNKNKQVPQFSDNEQKGEMNKKRYVLFVGNLPLDITENEIEQHFSTKVDTISSIRIPTKPDKTPRGFAYVEVTNNIDFEKGLSLNHTFLKKKRINVELSIPGGKKAADATRKFLVAKNMKLQALQKAGKLADGYQKKKPFKKEK